MTKGEMLARLEALLERVRVRAAQPRQPRAALGAERAPEKPLDRDDLAAEVGVPEQRETAAPSAVDEAPISDGLDSRERLVAAQPSAFEPAPAVGARTDVLEANEPSEPREPRAPESAPPIEMAEIEVVAEEEADDDEPPVSSRRPVAPQPEEQQPEEQLARMAFGAEEPPPLHTPPPESGRLPSAPGEFDPDVTGVRSAAPLPPRWPADPRTPLPAPPEFVPATTRVELAPSDAVASVVADAQNFAPSTFVALLDASLRL